MVKLEIHKPRYHFYKNDMLNSIHDIPSFQNIDGTISWRQRGHFHRFIGPALIYSDGEKEWYENGKRIKSAKPKK